jgi:SSS family solute:Na+ symporter
LLAKTDKGALRGITLGAALCLPVWTAFMLIGSLLWSFYRLTGEVLPSNVSKADQVFPHFLMTHIPPGLSGLFIAALLGSAMSMLASDMNCLAVVGVEDFYRSAKPKSTDREALIVGRWIVAGSGLAAAAVALRLVHTQGGALQLYYTITAIVAGGLAGLFLLAFLFQRATREGAIAGIVANLLFTIWATLTLGGKTINLGRWNFPWHDYMIGAVGHIILLLVGVVVSFCSPMKSVRAPEATFWGWKRKHHNSTSESLVPLTSKQVVSTEEFA